MEVALYTVSIWLITMILLIRFNRMTKPDHKVKKFKIVHNPEHDAAPLFL